MIYCIEFQNDQNQHDEILIGGEVLMVTVKMLKPYYIKTDAYKMRVILAYQYFSILISKEVYHFVPLENSEIVIDRKTKRIVNIDYRFAFQKGKDLIYFTVSELISLPDFLIQLYFIVESYDARTQKGLQHKPNQETEFIIKELERMNVKKLIDHALDKKDEKLFYSLVKLL